MIKFLISY